MTDERCRDCDAPLDDGGDGWDGYCADCADAHAQDDDLPEDPDDGPWSGPGERTFNEGGY